VDLVPLPGDPFTQAAFQRRHRLAYDEAGNSATFITPEDIILAKLIAFHRTGSDKHMCDARGVLVTQWGRLDLEAVRRRARSAGVLDRFEKILEAASREVGG
jgi:hypothetical protein